MASQDMTIWQERWKALHDTIIYYYNSLDKGLTNIRAGSLPEEKEASDLLNLVACLEKFVDGQINFFLDGFGTKSSYILEESLAFHPDYVLGVIIDQIAFDLEVIRRIVDQRLSGSPSMKEALKKADRLALRALQPVVGNDKLVNDSKTTVITYFEKDPSIRVIPYAPVALIAVPLTTQTVPRDYLTIAHEVGHYVYRHGKLWNAELNIKEPIPRALARALYDEEEYPAWVQKWKEEIFADVYDCLVAGPVIALASQDLALQSSRTPRPDQTSKNYHIFGEFTEDDGEHPVPVLRPYIYIKVLEQMSSKFEEKALKTEAISLKTVAGDLKSRWESFKQVQEVEEITSHYSNKSGAIRFKRAREDMETIVDEILECLEPKKGMVRSDVLWDLWAEKWSNYPDESENLEALYKKFDYFVSGADKFPEPGRVEAPLTQLNEPYYMWKKWIERENLFQKSPKRPPTKDILLEIPSGNASKLEYLELDRLDTWNHVFHAGGWATKPGEHSGG